MAFRAALLVVVAVVAVNAEVTDKIFDDFVETHKDNTNAREVLGHVINLLQTHSVDWEDFSDPENDEEVKFWEELQPHKTIDQIEGNTKNHQKLEALTANFKAHMHHKHHVKAHKHREF